MNKLVALIGKSNHGKNRIREHGTMWTVIEERKDCLIVESQHKTNKDSFDRRRVMKNNDKDFEIIAGD